MFYGSKELSSCVKRWRLGVHSWINLESIVWESGSVNVVVGLQFFSLDHLRFLVYSFLFLIFQST
ncbi:hypothetical protein HanIR_Chr12g0599701 [Helianthus annuus]|nr:hypothetical protein HanIR_Chr12g0599701 [Helianthus annuus]